jgi:hypothetical protein
MKKEGKKVKVKKGEKSSYHFVKLKSLSDLARNVSTFGDAARPLYAFKDKNVYRLFCYSIKIGDTRLILYIEAKSIDNSMMYQPGMLNANEKVEFRATMIMPNPNMNVQNIPITELVSDPFDKKDGEVKVKNIGIRDYNAVVKGIISKSLEHEGIGKVYAFTYKSSTYIGAFNLLDEEDEKIFCYAKTDLQKEYGFFRYNYTTDKVEATNIFGEHSYLYVKIINLADAFIFFKPE